ncbi:MAG: exodeoxyribonuclease V subunit gamma, partial [Candidatus Aeolococcus gillhamiae]
PTRGVERWLTQTLSATLGTSPGRADGVCANVEFPFPGAMVSEATTAAVGIRPADDPWAPRRAVWPLLEVVDANLGEPWLAMLAAHIAGRGEDPEQARRARRFSAVRHLADLLDRYSVHRPAMVRSWSEGEETDGDGAALPEDLAWQARLWRQLRDRLGVASPAERMGRACELLRASPELADLPERLSLFGLTRLPSTYLDVLAALGVHRDVHLWLLHPSAALWDALAAGPAPGRLPRRREDSTADRAANPLLASWGRDAREMQLVLSAGGAVAGESIGDRNHPDTLLGRIQADIRANQDPPATAFPTSREARPVLAETDRSLQVHSCHGQARQVEVLRDAILHLLAGDPTLEPRDVIVMCPDIDAFAPLIHATFGPGREVAGGRSLHVRLADRSIRQTNPVFAALSQLLALAAGRVSASEILDFAASAPVRRRFRLDDDDLARVGHWVRQAGVRWGLDATGRGRYQLQRVEAGTWRSGLDRILLGVAMAEDDLRLFGGVLPLDDVDSSDVELAGVLAELVERVGTTVASFATPSTLSEWVARILAATDTLMDVAGADEWQRRQLGSALEEVLSEGSAAPDALLALTEVRALLTDRLRGQPTRANFRTGHLTMCTLVPMRSVPHRVVCLLGLDDGEFPRRTAVDGDDILERDPHVGDREARSEDRQLLLDALMAATDHLIVTYTG